MRMERNNKWKVDIASYICQIKKNPVKCDYYLESIEGAVILDNKVFALANRKEVAMLTQKIAYVNCFHCSNTERKSKKSTSYVKTRLKCKR